MDDGEKIWIIDYEYAGQNEASFEIGNLASEMQFSGRSTELLCDAYWHEHLPSINCQGHCLVDHCAIWMGVVGIHPGGGFAH